MEGWNNIIQTAMLGTDKRTINEEELNEDLRTAFATIQNNNNIDREEKFLQTAAVVFNYRQSGTMPLQKELTITPAPTEEKEYCNEQQLQLLRDILNEENIPILQFWLSHCERSQKIITPYYVPNVLAIGEQQKKLQTLINNCCGKRAAWLAGFNPVWDFGQTDTPETIWETGTTEQRKKALEQIRETDPNLGLAWLQKTWSTEDAATRLAFLEVLNSSANVNDISFLESLATDKSKKVKDEALSLLKTIPESAIVQQYMQALQQSVSLKKEKHLLGLKSKQTLVVELDVPEAVYKTGIDKLSNNKALSDEIYILYQLTAHVPPSFWESQLQLSKTDIIQLLEEDETGIKIVPAFINAVVRFKDKVWAEAWKQQGKTFYVDIIPLLSPAEQGQYCQQYMKEFPGNILQYALRFTNEWAPTLAKEILSYTAKETYQYNRAFYSSIIHLLPFEVIPFLNECKPSQEYYQEQWNNLSAFITKLLQLKQQTLTYFNSKN